MVCKLDKAQPSVPPVLVSRYLDLCHLAEPTEEPGDVHLVQLEVQVVQEELAEVHGCRVELLTRLMLMLVELLALHFNLDLFK